MTEFQHNAEWEFAKRKRNLADGFKEAKGLRNGYCNRRDCQAALSGQPQSWMRDHERFCDGERLYYCEPCTQKFDDADRRFQPHLPRRCTREGIRLPRPTPDQQAYLEKLKGNYSPPRIDAE